jgi:flagellar basal-body rod protein FlgG
MDTTMQAAVSGIIAAETQVDVRANNIANINTAGFKGSRADQASTLAGTKIASISESGEDLASDIVNLKVSGHAHSANAKVAKIADEMLGTIIDLKA